MKQIRNLIVMILGVMAFTACDSNDTDRNIYYPANTEAAFSTEKSSYAFGADDPTQFEVTVLRGNASGSASVPVTAQDAAGLFTIPTTADFADGATEAKVVVSFDRNKLTVGQDYKITLTIPETLIKESIISHTLTITRDYVWVPFVTGTFTSTDMFEDQWEQVMERAEGTDRYRLISVIAEGYHLVFDIAEDGSISLPGGLNKQGYYTFTTGYEHPTYGMVYMDIDPDLEFTFFNAEEKLIQFSAEYYVGAGSFGPSVETFTW